MLLASLVGIACWTPPHVSLPQAASTVRMTASSSIDSGTRLETSQTLKEMKGVVEPTGSVTSWFDAGIRLRQPTKAELLQRYLNDLCPGACMWAGYLVGCLFLEMAVGA